jgi:L-ribulose-5-phosphate 3-epimerase UlaE
MYQSFYEQGENLTDAKLIANTIDHALMAQKIQLEMTVHFMNTGCFITILLGNGHGASWNINWALNSPYQLDTGVGFLSLADPNFEAKLADHITKIAMVMTRFCGCSECDRRVVFDFGY